MELYKCHMKKKISFSFLFQISYWVVFFQIDIFINLLNLDSDGLINFFFVNDEIKKTSIILSKLALLAFVLGNISYEYIPKYSLNLKSLPKFNLGKIEYLTGALLILYVLMSGDMILGEYTPENTSQGRAHVHRLFQVFFTTNLIFRLQKVSYFGKLPFSTKVILISYILLSIFIGDRGPLIVIGFIFFLFYMRENNVSILKSCCFGLIGALLLSFIGSVRQLRYVDSSYANRISRVFTDFAKPSNGLAEGGIYELAKSGRCLPAAIDYKKYHDTPFLHFQKMYLLSTIPFLSGFYLNWADLDPQIYSSSSSLISYHLQGGNVLYGNGTSVIADLYLDFGFYGAIFIMGYFGFFIKKTENQFYEKKNLNFYGLFFIIFFSVAIYIPRSAMLMQLEKIIFIFIFISLLSLFKEQSRNKHNF